jgi:hypothetical protein
MPVKLRQRPVISVGSKRIVAIDFTPELDNAALLTGTPTVSFSPAGPTTDNIVVNTTTINILDKAVVTGKAVQFRITGGLVASTTYTVTVTVNTNSSPSETLIHEFQLKAL